MRDMGSELTTLLQEYQMDTKAILRDHPDLLYLNALSVMRENLLEWFEFDWEASLLEIGSDYGALTGLFARKVKAVTVVDQDRNNLSVNRLRHEDCGNIQYAEDIPEPCVYDYVVMAGGITEPAKICVSRAQSLVKPGGKLILAVCNRLGLKYWAGSRPDAVCLSKSELKDLLESGGSSEFYYPMPDYCFPITIYSDSYLPARGEQPPALMAFDYPRYLKFDLGKMYDEVCDAGAFEAFANSFLVIWTKDESECSNLPVGAGKHGQNGGNHEEV